MVSAPQLQLFNQEESVRQTRISTSVLPDNTVGRSSPRPVDLSRRQYRSVTAALGKIFPTSQEISRVQQARRILGEEINGLSDEKLEECLTEFQFLIDSWFDEFEQTAYEGKTLREVIKEV